MRRSATIAAQLGVSILAALTMGASCNKHGRKQVAPPDPQPPDGASVAGSKSGDGGAVQPSTGVPEDYAGVDIGKLSPEQKALFKKLADSKPSPCGKAQSLLASVKGDPSCKRAPYALRYVKRLISADMTEEEANAIYDLRYGEAKKKDLDISKAAVVGSPKASIIMVEFFDYECPHCADFAPKLAKVEEKYGDKIGVYYKHFPITGHPHAKDAAIAAVAAQNQGKFIEMHKMMFENQAKLTASDLEEYAGKIGLDVRRFKDDIALPSTRTRVETDKDEGEKAGVEGTPTVYFNGREYSDPKEVADLSDWIDEELEMTATK